MVSEIKSGSDAISLYQQQQSFKNNFSTVKVLFRQKRHLSQENVENLASTGRLKKSKEAPVFSNEGIQQKVMDPLKLVPKNQI